MPSVGKRSTSAGLFEGPGGAMAGMSSTPSDPNSDDSLESPDDSSSQAFRLASSDNIAAEISLMNSLADPDEDAEFQALLAKESTCLRCGHVDMDSILVLEACDHRFCRECLRGVLTNDKADYQSRITCPEPGCLEIMPAFVYRNVLDDSEYEALEAASIETVLSTSNYIRCPSCNERFEKQPGEILGPDQDAVRSLDGSAMSRAALRHRAAHRFRCLCGVDFCDSCGSHPYHNGFNCESYKTYSASRFCRFCHGVIGRQNLSKSAPVADVCDNDDCLTKSNAVCKKILPCSHPCSGIARETRCLRCLKCPDKDNNVTAEEFCNICWVETLGSAPCIQLGCGHIFHQACVQKKLANRWPGSRISFGFLSCPLCKQTIAHSSVDAVIRQSEKLRKEVTALAAKRLHVEQMTAHEKITTPGSRYYNKPELFALDTFAFYQCFKCQKPYFGGKRECGDMAGLNAEQFDASELLCAKCAGSPSTCSKHGPNYIEYKCRYCCQVAVWFCWGNTHFCDKCHGTRPASCPACPGAAQCPLGVDHPPNGKEFSLGCALCRRGREREQPPPPVQQPARTRPRRDVIDLSREERPRRPRLQEQKEIIELD